MIQANELRIGNWVMTPVGRKEELFKPIPLSPEILVKCGFVKKVDSEPDNDCMLELRDDVVLKVDISPTGYQKDDFTMNKFYSNFSFPEMTFELWNKEDDLGVDRGVYISFEVKYLHQLQNLYYALTGTELEINL